MSLFRFRRATARRRVVQVVSVASAVAIAFTPITPVLAAPQGAEVVRGQASVQQDGSNTTIHAGRDAIIEYQQFNVAADESVRFVQPDASSRVLNRVTGGDASRIAGQLQANGIVYLVNPAGVYFTPGARINVSGLYAAAGNLSNSDFLSATDHFRDLRGTVSNKGEIQGDAVHLIGQRVANYGNITADEGVVTMLAGSNVLMRETNGRVYVKIDGTELTDRSKPAKGQTTPDLEAQPGVENTGNVNARKGGVTLGAGDMYALAVRNTGRVDAQGGEVNVTAAAGAVHNKGTLNASSAEGQAGSVTVQSPSVVNEGTVAADSDHGSAGDIEFTSQDYTYLLEGSALSATGGVGDADGGNVLVHSYDGQTVFQRGATIDVSGGALGGRGGFVEVSGQGLSYEGQVDLSGADGRGRLLIDPFDLYIVAEGNVDDDADAGDGSVDFTDQPGTDMYVSYSVLEAVDGAVELEAQNNIYVNHAVDRSVHRDAFTLRANEDINFNAPIDHAFMLNVIADADGDGSGMIHFKTPSLTNLFQNYTGDVKLHNDVTLSGRKVTFMDSVNAATRGGAGLTINASADFAKHVGNTDALSWLDIDGATTFAEHSGGPGSPQIIETVGEQIYRNSVTVSSEYTDMIASKAHFHRGLRADAYGDASLHIKGAEGKGNAQFDGVVGGESPDPDESRPLKDLIVEGTSQINGGIVVTTERQLYRDAVMIGDDTEMFGSRLIAMRSTVDGPFKLEVFSNNGNIDLDGNIGDNAETRPTELQFHAVRGIITVRADKIHAQGDIGANPNGREGIPLVATIAAPEGDVTFQSDAGSFTMGVHEKLTVLGDLNLIVDNNATLGDVNTLGDMNVQVGPGGEIAIRTRSDSILFEDDGTVVPDSGVELIAGGQFNFNVTPTFTGVPAPVFASAHDNPDPTGNLAPLGGVQLNVPLTANMMTLNQVVEGLPEGTVLDLRPEASDNEFDLAETFAANGDIPFTDKVIEEVLLSPQARQAMNQLALNVAPIGSAALQRRTAGRHLIDDSDGGTTVYRVRTSNALQVLENYLGLFVKRIEDEQTGEVRIESRTGELRTAIAGAWQAYTEALAEGQTPGADGFRAFLAQHAESHGEAQRYVQRIAQMLHDLHQSGVSPVTYNAIRDALTQRIKPDAMNAEQLRDLLETPAPSDGGAA